MHVTHPIPARLTVVVALAKLLQRLEMSRVPVGADQYRSVVDRLSAVLTETPADDALSAILRACPAAAELYENLNYDVAGLCRSPLDASLRAEIEARELITKLRAGRTPTGTARS
ncbi:MAG TPA: hypothetical protein VFP68_16230 [Burkholderiaceae bacterium]|nr:hypothetical protein [Burkholderiaceae bacterium]